jgi:hypothetical protein
MFQRTFFFKKFFHTAFQHPLWNIKKHCKTHFDMIHPIAIVLTIVLIFGKFLTYQLNKMTHDRHLM